MNNDYLIKSSDPLALTYNDTSPLVSALSHVIIKGDTCILWRVQLASYAYVDTNPCLHYSACQNLKENHHVAAAFRLMHQDRFAFMSALSKKVRSPKVQRLCSYNTNLCCAFAAVVVPAALAYCGNQAPLLMGMW